MKSRKGILDPQRVIDCLYRLGGYRSNAILPRYLGKEEITAYSNAYRGSFQVGRFPAGSYLLYRRYHIYFKSLEEIRTFFLEAGDKKVMESKEFVSECSEMYKISPAKVRYLMEEYKTPQQYLTITEEDGIVYSSVPEDKEATQCTLRKLNARSTLDLLIAVVMSPHNAILDGDDEDPRSYFTIATRSNTKIAIRDVQYLVSRIRRVTEETKDPYEVLKRCSEYTSISDQILPKSDSPLLKRLVEERKCIEIYGLRYDGYGIVTLPFKHSSSQRIFGLVTDLILYYMIQGAPDEGATSEIQASPISPHVLKVRAVREAYEKYLSNKEWNEWRGWWEREAS